MIVYVYVCMYGCYISICVCMAHNTTYTLFHVFLRTRDIDACHVFQGLRWAFNWSDFKFDFPGIGPISPLVRFTFISR